MGGDRGPAWEADIGGDRGDWSVVRSRKRKATQPEDRGRDRSRGSERFGGRVQSKGLGRQVSRTDDRDYHRNSFAPARVSNVSNGSRLHDHGRLGSSRRDTGSSALALSDDGLSNLKATFYFTNIPDRLPLFRLRKFFEVCGILSDVYLARRLNARGQVYGFVRFLNVKNRAKLGVALNNIWIGDYRVWAREARFDRFADFDKGVKVVRKMDRIDVKGGVSQPVVVTLRKGIQNVKVRKEAVEKKLDEGEKIVQVGVMDGIEVQKEEKNELKIIKKEKKCDDEGVVGKEEKFRKTVAGGSVWQPKERKAEESGGVKQLCYSSNPEDCLWAAGGMVARVVSGDSSLSLQQRVEDAGFVNVVVTPLGSDRVFLHCLGDENIWNVFNEAIHFFGMLFGDLHKWSPVEVNYERGAWLRVYGTPVHAWNELFFKLCVSGYGRFIRSDSCTVDKERFDFARVLISTSSLDIINSLIEVSIDGVLHEIKLVEEWGCYLGEDVFLLDDERVSPQHSSLNFRDLDGVENCQDDIDALVDDLNVDWQQGCSDHVASFQAAASCSVKDSKAVVEKLEQLAEQPLQQKLGDGNFVISKVNQVSHSKSCGVGSGAGKGNKKQVAVSRSFSNFKKKKQATIALKHTAGFIKRISRLPLKDRKKVLKVLKKRNRKKFARSQDSIQLSNSNSSNVSVNKEWEHWIVLHDKKENVAEDVRDIGKTLGVNVKGDSNIGLSLLTKEGRKELRAVRGSLMEAGMEVDGGSVKEGL